jgi:sugar diacid utilization regulator
MLRGALDAFVAADLHVATAAKALFLHPNSLRYRLGRIARCTGRDPRRVADLLELIAAIRVLDGDHSGAAAP